MSTVNPDGSEVLVEAVYYRYHTIYRARCDSIEEARGFLEAGEDYGECASVGVFVDGQPHMADPYVSPHPPSEQEAARMREDYAKAIPRP